MIFPDAFQTVRLTLRPVSADDAQAVFDGYGQDTEVTRYLTWRPHASIRDAESYVQMCVKAENART